MHRYGYQKEHLSEDILDWLDTQGEMAGDYQLFFADAPDHSAPAVKQISESALDQSAAEDPKQKDFTAASATSQAPAATSASAASATSAGSAGSITTAASPASSKSSMDALSQELLRESSTKSKERKQRLEKLNTLGRRPRAASKTIDFTAISTLDEFYQQASALPFHKKNGGHQFLRGSGPVPCKVLIVGLRPSAEDLKLDTHWSGARGELLKKMLKAIHLEPNLCHYTCLAHVPGTQKIMPRDATTLRQFLLKEVELVQPQSILILGETTAQILFETGASLLQTGGQVRQLAGINALATFDPQMLLQYENLKSAAWSHLQEFQKLNAGGGND